MRDDETPPPKATPAPARAEPEGPPRVRSGDLLGPSGQLEIEHAGRIYRLRVTQQGKLILTA
jgi:hemin uptake protein HemP